MMMARLSLLNILPRLASAAPFLCLMVAQCECPDMADPSDFRFLIFDCRPAAPRSQLIIVFARPAANQKSKIENPKSLLVKQLQLIPRFLQALIGFPAPVGRVKVHRLVPSGAGKGRLVGSKVYVAQVVPNSGVLRALRQRGSLLQPAPRLFSLPTAA